MVTVAGPLLALTLTDDVRLIAAVSFMSMLPWLVLSLPVGVLIDRHDRRTILTIANLCRALLVVAIVGAIVVDVINIWFLLIAVLLLAVCEVFFDMSAQAFLPSIVEEQLLERANGRLYAMEVVMNSFIGLPLGAWLFVVAAFAPFGIQAIALTIAAVLIAGIKPHTSFTPSSRSRRFNEELREGFGWLWRHPLLKTLALMLGAANMCHMFAQAVFAKYVRDELGLGPTGFGYLLAAISIGAIGGGLIGSRVSKLLGPATAIVLAYTLFAVLEIIPAAIPEVWAVVLAGVLMSIVGTIWNVITVSLRQRLIPAELFGRVNSVYRFLGTGSTAIGALIGGQIAFHFGLRATYWASAATLTVVLVVGAPQLLRHTKAFAENR